MRVIKILRYLRLLYVIYWDFNLFEIIIKSKLSSMKLNTEDITEKTNVKYWKSNYFLS